MISVSAGYFVFVAYCFMFSVSVVWPVWSRTARARSDWIWPARVWLEWAYPFWLGHEGGGPHYGRDYFVKTHLFALIVSG